MATIDLTSTQLKSVGFYKVMGKFILFPRKGWHIRLDQKPIVKGSLSIEYHNEKGEGTGVFGYRISSFHIKQDNNYSIISEVEGAYLGKKINIEDTQYVYFVYMSSGVWQPIWGYGKYEEMHKGELVWRPDARGEMTPEVWSSSCTSARWFLSQLSKATKEDHGLAMGPVQGGGAYLSKQL